MFRGIDNEVYMKKQLELLSSLNCGDIIFMLTKEEFRGLTGYSEPINGGWGHLESKNVYGNYIFLYEKNIYSEDCVYGIFNFEKYGWNYLYTLIDVEKTIKRYITLKSSVVQKLIKDNYSFVPKDILFHNIYILKTLTDSELENFKINFNDYRFVVNLKDIVESEVDDEHS